MTPENSFYLFDWCSFTSKCKGIADIIDLLGFNEISFQNIKGANGYRDRLYYDNVSIHYNGREDMGVWNEMSGQGCRVYESYGKGDFHGLFSEILNDGNESHFTRVDIAFDDHDGLLDMEKIFSDTIKKNFVSRFGDYAHHGGSKGTSVEFGRKGSDVFIRIYDKAAERKLTDGSHWVRVEIQLRDERATEFARRYVEAGDGVISEVFLGVVKNYLRFVKPQDGDDNRWRWPMTKYWERFLAGAERVRLYKQPGTDYNMGNLEDFVFKQAGNAIDTYIQIRGADAFLEKVKKRGTCPNPKYERLKDQYKNVSHD